jgi:ABC transporter substrate binding protein
LNQELAHGQIEGEGRAAANLTGDPDLSAVQFDELARDGKDLVPSVGKPMERREFIILLGGAAAWPISVRAQQMDRARRIGVLMAFPESDSQGQNYTAAFRDGLRELGWTDGRNVRIDTRWAPPAEADSTQRCAKELVALQPDLVLSNTTPTTTALLQQTRTIPIVFTIVTDPVGSGIVASFSRPGGNVTGFTASDHALGGKWIELLKQIAPHVNRVAMLFNPATAKYADYFLKPFKAAAPSPPYATLLIWQDKRCCIDRLNPPPKADIAETNDKKFLRVRSS